jgi:tripartite-type tricarboxylate transporter receptor subunit TctC
MPSAATYPSKPIKILVTSPPGGPGDTLARIIADKLPAMWGQPVTVENKVPMHVGWKAAADAAPDGYTIAMGGGSFFITAGLYRNLPYDSVNDFVPVSLIASIANVLVVHPSVPVRSLQEFIDYAKAHPGELKYGSSGFAGPPHLAAELFVQATGVDIVHVPYKGHVAAGDALAAGKEVQCFFDAIVTAKPHIDKGDLIGLAVTSVKRAPIIPQVPSIAECGVKGYEMNPDMGVIAPKGTPPEIVAKLSAAISKIMQSPEVKKHLQNYGMESLGTTPEEFGAYMKTAFAKWAQVLKKAGIAPRDLPA